MTLNEQYTFDDVRFAIRRRASYDIKLALVRRPKKAAGQVYLPNLAQGTGGHARLRHT